MPSSAYLYVHVVCRICLRDGDPSTREPQDLVGQGVAAWDQSSKRWRAADVKLQGRGIFGKLVTKRTK